MGRQGRGHRIVTTTVEHHAVGHTLRYLEKFGFEVIEVAGRPLRPRGPRRDRGGDHGPDDPRLGHVRQQRGRHDPADRRDRRARSAPPRASPPRRRRAGRAVVDLDLGALGADLVSLGRPQVRGPAGRRPPLRPARDAHPRPGARRQPGAPPPRGHRGRRRRRRHGHGVRPRRAPSCRRPSRGCAGFASGSRRRCSPRTARSSPAIPTDRLPGILSFIARGTDGNAVVLALDLEGVAGAIGSACTSGSTEVSHVLTAMGYPEDEARGSLRLSLGRTTTQADIDAAAAIVPSVLAHQRLPRSLRVARARPRFGGRASAPRRPPEREPADESGPRRDVGRGRQLGRGGARTGCRARGDRRLDAPP